MVKVNYVFSGLMMLLALWILYLGTGLTEDAVGWPRFFAFLLIFLSVGLILDTIFNPKREATEAIKEDEKLTQSDKKPNRNLIYSMVFTVLYVLFMEAIGFLLLTPILLGSLFWLLKYRSIYKLALFSIGTTVALTVIFQFLLGVPLPQGILDNLF